MQLAQAHVTKLTHLNFCSLVPKQLQMNTTIYIELPFIQPFIFLVHYPEICEDTTGNTKNKFRNNATGEKDFIYCMYL